MKPLRPCLLVLSTLLMLLHSTACREEPPVTTPEGGYLAFQQALLSGDAEELWAALSDDTQALFVEGWTAIAASRLLVERLDPSDRADARRQAGLHQLERVDGPESLFGYLFNTDLIFDTPAYVKGLRAERVEEMASDVVWVHTRAEQRVELLRDADGVWRVREPLHEAFAARIMLLENNRANLETAVALFSAAAQPPPQRPSTAPTETEEADP